MSTNAWWEGVFRFPQFQSHPIKVSCAWRVWRLVKELQTTWRPASSTPRHRNMFKCVRLEQRGVTLPSSTHWISSANLGKQLFKADPSKKPPRHLIGPLNRNSGHGWPQSQNKPLLVTCGSFEPFSDTLHLTSEPSITNLLRRWQDVPTRQSRVSVAALR